MNDIHPTAIVDPKAQIGENVKIGPFSIIGPDVKIDDGCEIHSSVQIIGKTSIGKGCRIYKGANIGQDPQDLKYANEETSVEIGDNNIIREFVTIHRGTVESGITHLGDDNLLMAYVHIAHDCHLGSNIIIANVTQLAGHVEIHDKAIVGGLSAIHQFSKIGSYSMIGASTKIVKDVIPFALIDGNPARVPGPNLIGLRRNGFNAEQIRRIKEAYKILYYKDLHWNDSLTALREFVADDSNIQMIVDFIDNSDRGIAGR
jgi:UDP-N-acetylglucosamine acyltransferase